MQEVKRVVTPIDFSGNAGKIASSAAYVAGKFGADLDLVFVVQNFDDYSGFFVPPVQLPNLEGELIESAKKRMTSFVEEQSKTFESYGVGKVSSQVLSGDICDEIINYVAEVKAQLIVMGTHGYKGLERIMFGSIAEKVVKSACCPVMTINPYDQECEQKNK